jgi:hypothetical protein
MSDAMRAETPGLREGLQRVPDQVALETEDFTEEQLAHRQEEPVWAQWSVDQQIRHIASPPCTWLLDRFRDKLIARGHKPPEIDLKALRDRKGPFIPPGMAPDREAVIELMHPLFAFCDGILERESPSDLRSTTFQHTVAPNATFTGSSEKLIDFMRLWPKVHPFGASEDPARPGHFTFELGTILRQIYWEALAHLRTIQRFKRIFGLPEKIVIPRLGYLTLPKYYD